MNSILANITCKVWSLVLCKSNRDRSAQSGREAYSPTEMPEHLSSDLYTSSMLLS